VLLILLLLMLLLIGRLLTGLIRRRSRYKEAKSVEATREGRGHRRHLQKDKRECQEGSDCKGCEVAARETKV